MPTTRFISNALRLLGVALIVIGIVSCKVYKPHWIPPEGSNYSENFDGTAIERFLKWSALGAIVFVIGTYIRSRKEPQTTRAAGLRRKGIILLFIGLILFFIPFNLLIPVGPICFVAGVVTFILGTLSGRKEPTERIQQTIPPSNSSP